MALITRRICDNVEAHDDAVEGSEQTYTLNGKTVTVDQCPACAQPFQDMFSDLLLIGRTTDNAPVRRQRKTRGGQAQCPYGHDTTYPAIGYVYQHVRKVHPDKLASWLAETGYEPRDPR